MPSSQTRCGICCARGPISGSARSDVTRPGRGPRQRELIADARAHDRARCPMRLDSETLEEAQADVEALRAIVAILTSLTKQRLIVETTVLSARLHRRY